MAKITKADIIEKLGGPSAVARLCGVTPGAVSQWEDIPAKHQPKILREVNRRELGITPTDIILAGESASEASVC